MIILDIMRYAYSSIIRARTRTLLMLLAMAIAVSSVVLLNGIGESARRFVVSEFSVLGTHLLYVMPGNSETTGGMLNASVGNTTRPLTLADAQALKNYHAVQFVAPMTIGAAAVNYQGLERDVAVVGTTSEMALIQHWNIEKGIFLPDLSGYRSVSICVIGSTIENELFKNKSALGKWLRIGGSRFRVIGVLAETENSLGFNVNEQVVIPVSSSMRLFNTGSLFRILVSTNEAHDNERVSDFIRTTISARHSGEEDITVISQDAMLATFNSILNALTFAVSGIAAISLAVAGILIMNIMLVAVSQRTSEVGLLKAVGASSLQIVSLFLAEAALLSVSGAVVGVALSVFVSTAINWFYPALNVAPQIWSVLAGLGIAFVTGVLFGILPARRASRLDAIASLSGR